MIPGRIVRTLLASAALLLAAAMVLPRSSDPLQSSRADEARFYEVKATARGPWDVVILGDSRTLCGISPAAVAEVLPGRRILNFAYSSGGLNAEIYRAADARLAGAGGNGPRAVVMGITPRTLLAMNSSNEQFHRTLGKPRDERWLLRRVPALVRFFQPRAPIDLLRALVPLPLSSIYHRDFHDDGWIGSLKEPVDEMAAVKTYAGELTGKSIDPRLVRQLLAQTRAWTAAGIGVFAFRLPTTAALAELEDQLTGFDTGALARAFTEAGGVWLDFPVAEYATYDGSHLRPESAVALSLDLARDIRDRLETGPPVDEGRVLRASGTRNGDSAPRPPDGPGS